MGTNGDLRIRMVPPVWLTELLSHQILPEWERPCHRAIFNRKTSSERICLFISWSDNCRLGKYLLGSWSSRFLPWWDSHSLAIVQGNFKSKVRKPDCFMRLDIKFKSWSSLHNVFLLHVKSRHTARLCRGCNFIGLHSFWLGKLAPRQTNIHIIDFDVALHICAIMSILPFQSWNHFGSRIQAKWASSDKMTFLLQMYTLLW